MNGSVRYTGSLTMAATVNTSPRSIQCSVSVAASLRGSPLRRTYPSFRCVVLIVRTSPSHLPVEKPAHVCGAFGDGCGRRPHDQDDRSEEHTSELQSQSNLVCRLLLEKKT